jgi:predicted transcriptional regulator
MATDWIPKALELVEKSKKLTGATFITSGALLLGPQLFPKAFDPLSGGWRTLAAAFCIFSGALLLFLAFGIAWGFIESTAKSITMRARARQLSTNESTFLVFMGAKQDYLVDLDNLNYNAGLSRLEVHHLVEQLSRKGLVRINSMSDSLVSLTSAGKKRALELSRQLRITS